MPRRTLPLGVAALVAAALAFAAPDAAAHGGQYRGPTGPGLPPLPPPTPGVPDPYAPTPPGTRTPPVTPRVPPTTPRGEPQPPPATTPKRPPNPRGRVRTGSSDLTWQEWWEANEAAIRSGRKPKPFVTDDNPLFRIGGGEGGNRSDADRPARRAVETEILPVLRALASDPKEDPDVVASSLLAIAKVTDDEADVRLLLAATERKNAPALLAETSWIALGCLRRTAPDQRFRAVVLDRVRDALFSAFDDEGLHVRARCFAAFALGLLGDQPSGDDAWSADARQVVRGLWLRLQEDSAGEDLPVAMLVALSLQPSKGVPDSVREDLRALCVSGRLGKQSRGRWVRAHAVLALARLGAVEHQGALVAMVRSHSFDTEVRRSAALGLGMLAPSMEPEARVAAAAACLEVARSGDPDTAGICLIGASAILSADFAAGSSLVEEQAGVTRALAHAADTGAFDVRPFAALALATAAKDAGRADLPGAAELRRRALEVLKAHAEDESCEVGTRAAFCLALGITGDERSAASLQAVAQASSKAELLRAYACTALGLLGRPTPEVRAALKAAAQDPSSEMVRRAAARALGLIGDLSATPLFLSQIEKGGPDHVMARAAQALGDLGDLTAARRLAEFARERKHSENARAVACAALGLLGDLETVPSLSRLGAEVSFLVLTDALLEALSLL